MSQKRRRYRDPTRRGNGGQGIYQMVVVLRMLAVVEGRSAANHCTKLPDGMGRGTLLRIAKDRRCPDTNWGVGRRESGAAGERRQGRSKAGKVGRGMPKEKDECDSAWPRGDIPGAE